MSSTDSLSLRNSRQFRTARLEVTKNGYERLLANEELLERLKPESYSVFNEASNTEILHLYARDNKYIYARVFINLFGSDLLRLEPAGPCPLQAQDSLLSQKIAALTQKRFHNELIININTDQELHSLYKKLKTQLITSAEVSEKRMELELETKDIPPLKVESQLVMSNSTSKFAARSKYLYSLNRLKQQEKSLKEIIFLQNDLKEMCIDLLSSMDCVEDTKKLKLKEKAVKELLTLISAAVHQQKSEKLELERLLEEANKENQQLLKEKSEENPAFKLYKEKVGILAEDLQTTTRKLDVNIQEIKKESISSLSICCLEQKKGINGDDDSLSSLKQACEYLCRASILMSNDILVTTTEKRKKDDQEYEKVKSDIKKFKHDQQELSDILDSCENQQLPVEKVWKYAEHLISSMSNSPRFKFINPEIESKVSLDKNFDFLLVPLLLNKHYHLVAHSVNQSMSLIFIPRDYTNYEEVDIKKKWREKFENPNVSCRIIVLPCCQLNDVRSTALTVLFSIDYLKNNSKDITKINSKNPIERFTHETMNSIYFRIFAHLYRSIL